MYTAHTASAFRGLLPFVTGRGEHMHPQQIYLLFSHFSSSLCPFSIFRMPRGLLFPKEQVYRSELRLTQWRLRELFLSPVCGILPTSKLCLCPEVTQRPLDTLGCLGIYSHASPSPLLDTSYLLSGTVRALSN